MSRAWLADPCTCGHVREAHLIGPAPVWPATGRKRLGCTRCVCPALDIDAHALDLAAARQGARRVAAVVEQIGGLW